MRQNPIKKLLWWIFAIIILVVAGGMLINNMKDLKGIEDTNGPDDFTLQTITDENIIEQNLGMKGGVHIRESMFNKNIIISSDGMTGVYELLSTNMIGTSDLRIDFREFSVKGGNFKAAIVNDDKIIKEIDFLSGDVITDFVVEDLTGNVRLILAGEEAEFTIEIPKEEYDRFSHP